MSDIFSDENGSYQFQNLSKWQGPTKKMSSKYFTGRAEEKLISKNLSTLKLFYTEFQNCPRHNMKNIYLIISYH